MMAWFNGKKTTIGAAFLFAAVALDQVVRGVWGIEADWVMKTAQTFDWVGLAVAGTGLTHKVTKSINKNKSVVR